jgi:hypothetical protein
MVGGKIIEIKPERGRVRLWCLDAKHGDELAIYVAAIPPECSVGDGLWWQGQFAYWTPKDQHVIDDPLRKIGFSFDPRKENYR